MDRIHIWRIVFLSISLLLAGISGKPQLTLENPLWPNKLQFNTYPDIQDDDDVMTQSQEYVYEESEHEDPKRGFSMLARWKPFNVIGRQRTSIRDISRSALMPPAKYELVSAETRAFTRPGQPLRWG